MSMRDKSFCSLPQPRLLACAIASASLAFASALPVMAAEADSLTLEPMQVVQKRNAYGVERTRTATKTDTPLRNVPQSISVVTDEQIREAWLRQVRANHPDRLMAQGLPEEAIAMANRKLALINDAYDRLRRQRGLVPA